jgi:hypothetical protein
MSVAHERRRGSLDRHILYKQLNLAQQTAVSSLNNYGYELRFIRKTNTSSLVILVLNGNAVSIDEEGEIDTAPAIKIRT